MSKGTNGEASPEQGRKISIHSGGCFEGLGVFWRIQTHLSYCRFLLVHT